MPPMGTMRVLKLLVLTVIILAVASVYAYAQAAEGGTSGGGMNMMQWTPATVLTVLSVAFSFGVCYQTIVVQGKILKKLEAWKEEDVDPCLEALRSDVRVLQHDTRNMGNVLGLNGGKPPWSGTDRRNTRG